MAAIQFPATPSEGALHTVGNRKFKFESGKWKVFSNTPVINVIEQNPAVAMSGNNIDLTAGDYFKKTIAGATTLTISNVLPAGKVNSFVLKLKNGGSGSITWFSSNINWPKGEYPVLTANGTDTLGFMSDDGGATWDVFVMALDSKKVA